MSCNKFYVYQYIDENGKPFYIGKGSNNRINESHLPWVKIPSIEFRQIIKENLTEQEAFDLELSLIKKYGRKKDGGILENKKISRWVAQAGWKHSDETKDTISKSLTGLKKQNTKNYKKPKSKEHSKNIKNAVKKLWDDPNYKEQRIAKLKEKSFAHKGKPWSDARRAAQLAKQTNKGIT